MTGPTRLFLMTMAAIAPGLALGACACPSGDRGYVSDRRAAYEYRGDTSLRAEVRDEEPDWTLPENPASRENVRVEDDLDVEGDLGVTEIDEPSATEPEMTPPETDETTSLDRTEPMTLDGVSFDLETSAEGDIDLPDTLVFENGMLETTIAEGEPSDTVVYRAWPVEGGTEFSATADRGDEGKLEWRGTVRGDVVTGTVTRTPADGGPAEHSTFTGTRVR